MRIPLASLFTVSMVVSAADTNFGHWIPNRCDKVWGLPAPLQVSFEENNKQLVTNIDKIYPFSTYNVTYVTPAATETWWKWITQGATPILTSHYDPATCSDAAGAAKSGSGPSTGPITTGKSTFLSTNGGQSDPTTPATDPNTITSGDRGTRAASAPLSTTNTVISSDPTDHHGPTTAGPVNTITTSTPWTPSFPSWTTTTRDANNAKTEQSRGTSLTSRPGATQTAGAVLSTTHTAASPVPTDDQESTTAFSPAATPTQRNTDTLTSVTTSNGQSVTTDTKRCTFTPAPAAALPATTIVANAPPSITPVQCEMVPKKGDFTVNEEFVIGSIDAACTAFRASANALVKGTPYWPQHDPFLDVSSGVLLILTITNVNNESPVMVVGSKDGWDACKNNFWLAWKNCGGNGRKGGTILHEGIAWVLKAKSTAAVEY